MSPEPAAPFDLTPLIGTPTRLRATAAAIALVQQGIRPSVSEVARLAGVSRQALTKDHKPVTEFVASLRASWEPPTESPIGKLTEQLATATASLRKERTQRARAEAERDRALHHLQLAEATIAELTRADTNVRSISRPVPPRTSRTGRGH